MTASKNTGRLAGRTCIVTGAAQGIGRSIAERFASEGGRVIGLDLRFSDEDGGIFKRVCLDVTQEEAVARCAAEYRDASVLVNCVGYVATGAALDGDMDDFDRSYAINVRSMASMIRAFMPAMVERRQGSIVNIASVVSSVMAAPNRFAYATSKAAVIGLTMSVALDYVAHGVRCNAISPGTIETASLHDRWAATGDVESARAAFIARQPMGRLGAADEIASTALLLAGDEAGFMTGSNIVIDGGMSL